MSNRAAILFVEDELGFAIPTVDRLEAEGYSVELVTTGPEGLKRGRQAVYDLILLDVMLPGMSGFDVCQHLRVAGVSTPILMLTARGEVTDRVVGLKLGADDYLAKPSAVLELLARMEALLRRTRGRDAPGAAVFEFGEVRADLDRNQVTFRGSPVALSPTELRLLRYLLEHPRTIIPREELLKHVWGVAGDIMSRTIDVHMAWLRKKLESDPHYPRYFLTIKRLGYKLDI